MKKIIFLFLILFSCKSSKECAAVNKELVKTFQEKLKIVERQHKGKPVNVKEYTDALFYLSKTTSFYTNAEVGSTLGYINDEDYEKDIKLWKQWLKENKCKQLN